MKIELIPEEYKNKIINGHSLNVLKKFPDNSIDCVITSPPYWALRDYGLEPMVWDDDENCQHEWEEYSKEQIFQDFTKLHIWNKEGRNRSAGEKSIILESEIKSSFCSKCSAWRGSLGLEPTIELYLKHLLQIFDEVKRVLKPTGTCWVNLGDSYGTQKSYSDEKYESFNKSGQRIKSVNTGLPDKSLCLIPFRFAIEMVNRGWILRNAIIWHKPNSMPSSVKNRFTVDFEYVFFFVKSNKTQYWVNSKTGEITNKKPKGTNGEEGKDWELKDGKKKSLWQGKDYFFEQQYEPMAEVSVNRFKRVIENEEQYDPDYHKTDKAGMAQSPYEVLVRSSKNLINARGRNMRAVWRIPTQSFRDAHFAVFPEKLVEPMIKAGCPEKVCAICGLPIEKIIKKEYQIIDKDKKQDKLADIRINNNFWNTRLGEAKIIDATILGYTSCGHNNYIKGIVLDPFMGSGTTAVVAKKLNRNYIGIELNPEYIKIAEKRINSIPDNLFDNLDSFDLVNSMHSEEGAKMIKIGGYYKTNDVVC